MAGHLDHNGDWVLLVYAIATLALIAAVAFTVQRTRARQKALSKFEDIDT